MALQWLMNREIEDQVDLETLRMESNALASNQTTSGKYLEILFANRAEQEEEWEVPSEEWVTPQSVEELERLLGNYG